MVSRRDYLREAKTFEIMSGVLGLLWVAGSLVGVGWLLFGAFGEGSWLVTFAILIGSWFLKAVNRSSNQLVQESIQKGLDAGILRIDDKGLAVRVVPQGQQGEPE